jgi:hypothetical protein
MQDNFNIHGWQLKTAINELEETEKIKGKDGKGCWKGYRYAGTENGKDKCVPVKEGEIGLSDILARDLYKLQGKISDDLFYKLRKAINSQDPTALAKAKEIMSRIKPEDDRIYMGEEKGQCPECGCQMESTMCNECGYAMNENASSFYSRDYVEQKYGVEKAKEIEQNIEDEEDYNPNIWDLYVNMQSPEEVDDFVQGFIDEATFTGKYNDSPELKGGQKDLPDEVQAKIVAKEGEDHEVSMAQASLKSIISSASQLMAKLGDNERDIPGWIQDHIAKSENYIEQANQSFHELESSDNSDEMNEAMFTSANSNNPEGDKLVLRFLQGIAKKFDYPVYQAALFVKDRIKKLGY